jgi:hypothetical protein
LDLVIFESALSLRVMIETGKVNLRPDFHIKFVECDCALDFPGYSVQPVQDASDVFHLVKNSPEPLPQWISNSFLDDPSLFG